MALGDFLVLDALYAGDGTVIAVDDQALLEDRRAAAKPGSLRTARRKRAQCHLRPLRSP